MQFLETTHKRKSAAITLVLLLLFVVGILNFGLQYLDPPQEYGVAINFGNPDAGLGTPVEKTKAAPERTKGKKGIFRVVWYGLFVRKTKIKT